MYACASGKYVIAEEEFLRSSEASPSISIPIISLASAHLFISGMARSRAISLSPVRAAFLHKVFIAHYLKHRDCGCTGEMISPKVVPSIPFSGLISGDTSTADIGNPFAMPFAEVIMSGRIPACLMGEEFPCASVAALDFVGYQQCAGCGGDFAQAAQEIIIDHADSCNS